MMDRRADAGMTLMELILTIALLGSAIAIIVGVWGASIRFATQDQDRADLQAVLQSAADFVSSADVPRLGCAVPEEQMRATYAEAAKAAPLTNDFAVTVTDVQFYVGPPNASRPWSPAGVLSPANDPSCSDAVGLRAQLITLEVRPLAGGAPKTIEVVKYDL